MHNGPEKIVRLMVKPPPKGGADQAPCDSRGPFLKKEPIQEECLGVWAKIGKPYAF